MKILAIRSLALMLPLLGTAAAWLWCEPRRRTAGAVYLATLWTIPSLLLLHRLARYFGWWTFDFTGGGIFHMPADLLLGWALLWGALPALLVRRLPLPLLATLTIAFDLAFMPRCAPVVQLGPWWLLGELVAAAIVLVPAQLLARWTDREEQLPARVALQVVLFTGLVLIVIPSLVCELSNRTVHLFFSSMLTRQLLTQAAILAAIIGLTAVQELAQRGGGTPFPYDPPKRLVRSGIYAYVRDPMQLVTSALFLLLALATMNPWLAAAAVLSIAYAAGLAAWDEGADLRERFGPDAAQYRAAVRNWLPSWRPRIAEPSTIYFAAGCDPCSDIALWLQHRHPRQLHFLPAERHPTTDLDRVRYEAPDGATEDGIAAIARALEHIHLGWAILGFSMRLPIARPILQTIVDAMGGGRRAVISRESRPSP